MVSTCSAKSHKLKFGTDPSGDLGRPPEFDAEAHELVTSTASDEPITSQVSWRQGRQLLRQYLQEIGYTDTIIDVRSNRVRSLLGLEGSDGSQQENGNGSAGGDKRPAGLEQSRRAPPAKKVKHGILVVARYGL